MTIITIVCQTCGKVLGTKDGGGVEGISHSTCEKCLREHYSDIFTEEEIQEIINTKED
jgi:hypothetical protein